MKANVIFAAIVMSMISAVAFGQVEQEAAKAIDSAEGAVTGVAPTVAPKMSGIAGAVVKGSAAQTGLLDAQEQLTAESLKPTTTNEASPDVAPACQVGGAATLQGIKAINWNADVAEGYANQRCMYRANENTTPQIASIVEDIATAARMGANNTPYGQTTPEQQLASGEAAETAIAKDLGITEKEAANKLICLAEHENEQGQVDPCYLPPNWFAHSARVAAARQGVTSCQLSL